MSTTPDPTGGGNASTAAGGPPTGGNVQAIDGLTADKLARLLNVADTSQAAELLDEARDEVAGLLGQCLVWTAVPATKVRRAVLDVAGDLAQAVLTPNGTRDYLDPEDGGTVRVGLDTSARARKTLARYLMVGVA